MTEWIKSVSGRERAPLALLSAVFSGFATAAQKQLRPNLAALFSALARSGTFAAAKRVREQSKDQTSRDVLQQLGEALKRDLDGPYTSGFDGATESGNRGVLRALAWGKKVSSIQSSLISRYLKKGDALIEKGQSFFVCEACGFIIVKDQAPEIRPVCKAPAGRFVSYFL